MSDDANAAGYAVPTYREADDAPWYHFLHGNVPGHQIDFMYRAEVPQGPLTRQHFSHLARLMKYIEPQAGVPYAFAIGNLSRDDTQHEPGQGGVALMFGLRIHGVTDHVGRQDPPFAHAVAAIDRQLDRHELLATAGVFHRHVLSAAQSAEWYRSYVRCAAEAPEGMADVLADYVAGFSDLPAPPPSTLGLKWTVGESTPPARVVIVHDDDAPFGMIAACATKIAAVLFPSNIRWSAISNGREADLPNGVTVRLVAASNVTAADQARGVHRIEDVPDDEEELARQLFGVGSTKAAAAAAAKPVARGWRDEYAGGSVDESAGEVQRTSFAGEPPPSRRLGSQHPAAPPLATTWDRSRATPPAQGDIEVDAAPTSASRTAPEPARSTPPPARSSRPSSPEEARRSFVPSPPSYAARPAEMTRTVTAGLAQTALKAALPFTPAPAPTPARMPVPAPAPFPAAPALYDGPLPTFRETKLSWKGMAIGFGLGAIALLALYLVLRDPESPDPTPLLQPTSTAQEPAPTTAPLPTASPAPTAAPQVTAPPPATAAPTPTATAKATTTKPPVPPRKPKKQDVFGGPL